MNIKIYNDKDESIQSYALSDECGEACIKAIDKAIKKYLKEKN